jgi:hypothetical protein
MREWQTKDHIFLRNLDCDDRPGSDLDRSVWAIATGDRCRFAGNSHNSSQAKKASPCSLPGLRSRIWISCGIWFQWRIDWSPIHAVTAKDCFFSRFPASKSFTLEDSEFASRIRNALFNTLTPSYCPVWLLPRAGLGLDGARDFTIDFLKQCAPTRSKLAFASIFKSSGMFPAKGMTQMSISWFAPNPIISQALWLVRLSR